MKVLIKSEKGIRLEDFMKKHAASLNHLEYCMSFQQTWKRNLYIK